MNFPKNFSRSVGVRLASCGFSTVAEDTFIRETSGEALDWVSFSGNRFFYNVLVGVVFPDVFRILQAILASGASGVQSLDQTFVPIFFKPASAFMTLPEQSAQEVLGEADGTAIARVLCAELDTALQGYRDLVYMDKLLDESADARPTTAAIRLSVKLKMANWEGARVAVRRAMTCLDQNGRREFSGYVRRAEKLFEIRLLED